MNQSTLNEKLYADKRFFGHPWGLAYLFLTETWERFSYYGMRALLVLYMTKYLLIEAEKGKEIFGYETIRSIVVSLASTTGASEITSQMVASQIYGLYTGLVYLMPFFGGMLADRVLGQNKSVYLGAALMAIGHFLMAIESMFFFALLFLILGNGCFKPNISTQVGRLYKDDDPRRDGAFTIFYMGVNLGAMFSPLVCGTLGELYGWHYGFGAAGVGMIVGMLIYHFGQSHIPKMEQTQKQIEESKAPLTLQDWQRIGALVFLCVINIVFWAVYEQQGNTLVTFADEQTNRFILGWEMPASWYQSMNPVMIVLVAPILSWAWIRMGRMQGSSVTKMGIGCALLGISFVVMIMAAQSLQMGEKANLMWLVSNTLILSIGELYLSPIGLSLVTKIAPTRLISTLMGVWYMSSAFGNYLSGYIGQFYSILSKEGFFTLLAALGIGAGLIFFAANVPLKKAIGKEV